MIAVIPSSKHDDIKRGFNPNEMIARSFNDNIFTGLFKINDYKQTKQTDRSLVNKIIKIKDGEQLYNQDVLIFDDVITSGNTIMTCAKIIESYQPRSITLLVQRVYYLKLTEKGYEALKIHEQFHYELAELYKAAIPDDHVDWVFETLKNIKVDLDNYKKKLEQKRS